MDRRRLRSIVYERPCLIRVDTFRSSTWRSMLVPVMSIGKVRMVVDQTHVAVRVAVRLARGSIRLVLVRMMLVVVMKVFVLEFLVRVNMTVALPKKQRDAETHRDHGDDIERAKPLPQQEQRYERTDERSRREVRRLAGRSDQPQRVRIEHHADAVAEAPEDERADDIPSLR